MSKFREKFIERMLAETQLNELSKEKIRKYYYAASMDSSHWGADRRKGIALAKKKLNKGLINKTLTILRKMKDKSQDQPIVKAA